MTPRHPREIVPDDFDIDTGPRLASFAVAAAILGALAMGMIALAGCSKPAPKAVAPAAPVEDAASLGKWGDDRSDIAPRPGLRSVVEDAPGALGDPVEREVVLPAATSGKP